MNVRGERILIFGDSLTQHASGANPIWEVDQGPQRAHPAPGDLLASLLRDQGATGVRTNALVSRSAVNFWTREPAAQLIAADLAWRPTKIVFVLGTNDVGLGPAADEAAFVRLRDAYKPSKAELWAIGPFSNTRLPAAGVAQVAAAMGRVFGRRFIDGRPLSKMISPGSDGVHYTPTSARLLALNLADALISTSPKTAWLGVAVGAAIVVGGALVYGLATGRARGLAGGPRTRGATARGFHAFAVPGTPYATRETERRITAVRILEAAADALDAGEDPRGIVPDTAQRLGFDTTADEHRALHALLQTVETGDRPARPRTLNPRLRAKRLRYAAQRLRRSLRTQASIDDFMLQELAGVEIVDGRRWGGTPNELIRSGYKPVPCKSGLDKRGQARCWARGLGAPTSSYRLIYLTAGKRSVAPQEFPSVEDATRALRAFKAHGLTAWVEDATGQFVPVKGAQRKPRELGQIGAANAWLRDQRGLGAPVDDDDQRPGEDDETWWQRIQRRAQVGERRVRTALERHDALIFTTRGGREILVLKTPEMSNLEEGSLRVTTFDADGPIGHLTRRDLARLAEDVYRDWHPEAIRPASEAEVMAWTGTERFAKGAATVVEMQRRNRRGIEGAQLPPGAAFLVEDAARAVPADARFGRKVFIVDVHRELMRRGVDISLEDLKRELVRMHADRNVVLARADLVAALDPKKVAASVAHTDGGTFHFVLI